MDKVDPKRKNNNTQAHNPKNKINQEKPHNNKSIILLLILALVTLFCFFRYTPSVGPFSRLKLLLPKTS